MEQFQIGTDLAEIEETHIILKRFDGDRTIDLEPKLILGDDIKVNCFTLPPKNNGSLGSLEYEFVFYKRPPFNQLDLNINYSGLNAYYQRPLTGKDIAEGCRMPDNVLGSYAFYHDTRKGLLNNRADAEKYKCGKAFHLYRPSLIDALGRTSWASLLLNGNHLSIVFDPVWMDNAAYPVVLDPNFGYESFGGSSVGNINFAWGFQATPAGAGTLDSITAYMDRNPGGGSVAAKSAVYKDSDESRIDFSSSAQNIVDAPSWNTFTLNSGSITAVAYRLMVGVVTSGADWYLDFNSGPSPNTSYSGTWDDPHGFSWSSSTDRDVSVYATYTAADGVSVPVMMHHYKQMAKGRIN